jgi:hypothetical protein
MYCSPKSCNWLFSYSPPNKKNTQRLEGKCKGTSDAIKKYLKVEFENLKKFKFLRVSGFWTYCRIFNILLLNAVLLLAKKKKGIPPLCFSGQSQLMPGGNRRGSDYLKVEF